MKKMMCLLMLMSCGTDDGVSVNCEQANACPVTTTVKAEAPVAAPVQASPVAAQTVESAKVEAEVSTPIEEPRDYTVHFSFLVTTRDTRNGNQFCDTRYEAEMKEGGDPYAWTCNGEPAVFPDGLDGWDMNYGGFWTRNYERIQSVDVVKDTFEDLKSNIDCKVSGAKRMKCNLTDNYIEIFTRVVMDRDQLLPGGNYKSYMNINWKVYYWPDLSGY